MPEPKRQRPYRWLAEYYDQLFTMYVPVYQAIRKRALGDVLPSVDSACDLACGTGRTAVELAGQGIKMYGVDLSPSMCRLAREKARRARLPVTVIQADMRDFRLPEPVDLVLCEGDALNHIPRKQDLALVARAVARALRPGGHFYFDVNNRLSFRKVWPGTWWVEKPAVALVMHGGYDRERDRGWTNVEWFIREGRLWRRRRERVEQVCWSQAEMRAALRRAGFERVRAWDEAPFMKAIPAMCPGCRTIYLARKSPRR